MQKEKIQGFGKDERLYRKKEIKELFDKGSSFYLHPLKVIFMPNPASDCHQVLFTVSKRNFKRAPDRNLVKRRMRESYRKHKTGLKDLPPMMIAYIYARNEMLDYSKVESAIIQSFTRIRNFG
ncbi:ribonuclease P protein component [Fulvivirga sedimenti]|uniref:Ribonuclease P protein component n=1 Tax=Fulvivirga sedimenti TaxID=2879465 RepID=A0A9X1L088_9BACT|nr:ribonuclease P protein component [Fulvivirga sedimenti]MCA6079235.1 ribonuclease P protein component [Fulvivirga sedimenti]